MSIVHNVIYNSQRDNDSFGILSGNSQCFTTCSFMLLTYYLRGAIAADDKTLARYLDDVEHKIGRVSGAAEDEIEKDPSLDGKFTSLYWVVQEAGINKWLHNGGSDKKAIFTHLDAAGLEKYILDGPIIFGTNKIVSGIGGHIILIVGRDKGQWLVHDPFGNAVDGYKTHKGEYVIYPDELIFSSGARASGAANKFRTIFVR